jgi:nitroreductase
MDAIEAIRSRRSIRQFRDEPVERPLIEAVIADAAHAPWTPISVPEPWVFTVIEGAARLEAFGARALDHARRNRPQREGYGWLDNPDFSVFHHAPAAVIISGKRDNPLALEECTRAAQVLTIAANARGLGSCWVGSPNLWLGDPGVQQELGIPVGFVPCAAIVLGYAAVVPPPPRVFEPRTNWI